MKTALIKDSVKEIKNTYKRFISILLMAFLGVGFFAGIRATSPDMVATLDKYYKEQNVYDIQVVSTMGLTKEDVEKIGEINNIEKVEGTYEKDAKLEIDNKEIIIKLMCVDSINEPLVIEGRKPENANECIVEEAFLVANNKKIGDVLTLDTEKTTNDEGEEIEFLKQNQLEIVGTAKSPLYLSSDRGTSSLGAGKINYYMYISKDNVNASDIYTGIYVKVANVNKFETSGKKYEDYVENAKHEIESIKEEREKTRYDNLIAKATEKVDDAQRTLDEEKTNAQSKISEAEDEIKNGKIEIQKAEDEINQNEQKADKELKNAQTQINNAKEELKKREQQFKVEEQKANTEFAQLEVQKQELQITLGTIESGLTEVNNNYNQVLNTLQNTGLPEEQIQILEQTKIALEQKKQELEKNKTEIQGGITKIDEGIATGKKELENGRLQINNAKTEIQNNQNKLNNTKQNTKTQIANAKSTLEKSKQEIENGEKELEEKKKEFEEKIADAESKLVDAREEISNIENPKWYVLDRYANVSYNSFIQDTGSVANIGKVFPIVFFVVATLISLTSMTRMVEEQRTQIGTLKALGYNKFQIASKYVIYASFACIIGGILGMCVGFVIIPKIIWMMYQMMYQMSDIVLRFDIEQGGIGLILISVCIIGATIYATIKELINTPATLMRPKAPKSGKRVFLERITFIWKKLSFSRKVTVRNIFRYKKRFLMTIIGIFGCTSLILAGFGLKDSISQIMPSQFERVFNYDMQVSLKNGLAEEQRNQIIQKFNEKDQIQDVVETYMLSATLKNDELDEDTQIIVPENQKELEKVIKLIDINTKETVNLNDNEIAITDKLAQLLNVKVGDNVVLKDNDDNENQVKIGCVVENYISHYVYMSKEMYESLYDEGYRTNVLLIKNDLLDDSMEDELAKEIMGFSEVGGISRTSSIMKSMDDTMKSLNYVVIVLIVSAGLLAFVVLYNLSNVNISERIRELATIKVLGFYDREVYSYVSRETTLLTLIGTLLGLIGGYFLNFFIIGTCEINMLRFNKIVEPMSYLYAVLITVGFTMIVNIATYFALKKIDMIESLKSVE